MARRATNVTRARIQDVALTLFATRGYALTSLLEIAAALDVTKAALYFYFPATAQLLHSLEAPLLDGVHTLLDAYTDGPRAAPARREVVYALTDLSRTGAPASTHRWRSESPIGRCCASCSASAPPRPCNSRHGTTRPAMRLL